jgi:hypothetical protein
LGYIYLVYHQDGVAFATGYVPVLGEPWQQPSAKERVYQSCFSQSIQGYRSVDRP